MTKKKIAIVLAVAILLVGAFAVFSNIQKEKDEWSAFLSKSENGEPCFAEFPSASGQTTIVAFDGKEYTARRNDGTIGTGKYLIEVKGTLPKASGETVFTYISDNQYTFEEIADDLLGARHQSLSYFLL